jgi:presequence protease
MVSNFLAQIGETYRDFIVTKILPIEELQCTLRELVHEPSGAMIMHLEVDDPENLFCLSFKTLPDSSNGAAHILEHTVLCGSRRYPVKDPFFAMNRRSLNTFMNALTGADFTCYPAASQVEKDFYNLLDVYLDAVFHPLLKELSFLQEGHRLEFSDPEDPESALECKGIVYNEMKGNMASPDSRLWHELMALLTPDLPYAFNSGGDPKDILSLTYAQLIHFHETFYHPSRCLFFFYGNFPLKKHLDVLAEKTLKNVPKEPPIPPLPLQKRFKNPIKKEISYPISQSEDLQQKTIVSFGWLTAPIIEQEELLALAVIDCALMDTDASPLKAHLLASNLCIQVDAFMDIEMSEVPYTIICKGCKEERIEDLEACLKGGLEKVAKDGIPKHLIDAALHQIEFSRTEITGDQAPFGLTLFMRSALAKQHGCPAENALILHAIFSELLKKTEDPNYLKRLIRKHFIDNTHFVRLTMKPDPELTLKETENEKEILETIKRHFNKDDVKKILIQTKDLERYQKQTEEQKIDCLPKVTIEDVPLSIRDFPLIESPIGNLKVFHHDCFTNHIVYADLFLELPEVTQEDLPYLQLLLNILPELGAGDRSYMENLDYMQAHTGGLGFSFSLFIPIDQDRPLQPSLHLRGKALGRKADQLLKLMQEEITAARLDEKARIAELIDQIHVSLENKLPRNAARYASMMAQSGLSKPAFINNVCHGLPYFQTIRQIAEKSRAHLDDTLGILRRLYHDLFITSSPHLIVSCDQELFDTLKQSDFNGLSKLEKNEIRFPWKGQYSFNRMEDQARIIAAPVAFNAESFAVPAYLDPSAPALHLASQLFDNLILHPSIRERGGAYGSSATYTPLSGLFTFHSYRDPHIASSWKTFHKAIETIARQKFSSSDLEEAKLGLIQGLDSPVSPGNRGLTSYIFYREGRSPQQRQQYRERLLSIRPEDVSKAVEEHLLPIINQGTFISFAGKGLIEQENKSLSSWGRPLLILPT